MTRKLPVGSISVVTLIRTDTTLDHSQKAEKVWAVVCKNPPIQNTEKEMQPEMGCFAFPVARLQRRVLAACFFQNINSSKLPSLLRATRLLQNSENFTMATVLI